MTAVHLGPKARHSQLETAIDHRIDRLWHEERKAPHLVAALAHGIGVVLGQVAVDAKSNEIPAVRELLKAFGSLADAVIIIDVLHTQSDTRRSSQAGRRAT